MSHDLPDMPFCRPTFEEALRTTLRDLARRVPERWSLIWPECTAVGVTTAASSCSAIPIANAPQAGVTELIVCKFLL